MSTPETPDTADHARTMLRFAREVVSTLDLDAVLQRVLEIAQELTGARYAALGVLDDQHTHLERFLTAGIDEETRRLVGILPRGHGVLGELIRNPTPLRLDDVGRHPRSYGFPFGHPPMQTFLGVPIMLGEVAYGNFYLTEKDGGFTDEDEEAVVTLATWAAVAIENARVHTSVAARRDELEQNVAALSAMMDIALALGGETHLDAVLELIVKRARALVSARAMAVALLEGDRYSIAATAGEFPPELVGVRVPLAGTVVSEVVRTGQAQRLDDGLNRQRFERAGFGAYGVRADEGLFVPLQFRDRTVGVVIALDRLTGGPGFSERDEQLLLAFATAAATAVATARNVQTDLLQSRLAAAEAERRRWAQELHDETLQALAMLRITLSSAARRGEQARYEEAVRLALDEIDVQIASLRGLIAELRPTALDDLGLGAALEAFADRATTWGAEVDLDIELTPEGEEELVRLAPELEAAAYRIVQEAVNNAGKHAGASHIHVAVRDDAANIHIEVRDDGQGFDPTASSTGFGLRGMRERAELAGGAMEVETLHGRGTVVRVTLPVSRRTSRPPV